MCTELAASFYAGTYRSSADVQSGRHEKGNRLTAGMPFAIYQEIFVSSPVCCGETLKRWTCCILYLRSFVKSESLIVICLANAYGRGDVNFSTNLTSLPHTVNFKSVPHTIILQCVDCKKQAAGIVPICIPVFKDPRICPADLSAAFVHLCYWLLLRSCRGPSFKFCDQFLDAKHRFKKEFSKTLWNNFRIRQTLSDVSCRCVVV